MKKTFLLGLCILTYSSLFAQEKFVTVDYNPSATYGIKAGFTFPRTPGLNRNLIASNSRGQAFLSSASIDDQSITSFYVGGVVNIPISKSSSGDIYIQPGLSFVGKGGQSVVTMAGANSGSATFKETISYLQLPINLLVSLKAGTGKFLMGAGPYVGFTFGGEKQISSNGAMTQQLDAIGINSNSTSNLQIGSGGDIKTIDFGFDLQAGYQLKNGFGINIGANIGLTNVDSKTGSNVTVTNQLVSVGLGYSF